MVTVPPHLTAYQGFDALFHSAEGYINKLASPISDIYALKSIELIGKSLAAAVKDGRNLEAREDVALANTLAGMVESTSSCTSEHSLAHALSAYHPKIEHGAALIMVSLAYFSHFANSGVCDKRMTDMARALGKADASGPMDFVEALASLQKACGVDDLKMSGYGVDYDELDKYTRNARETMGGLFALDPAALTDENVTEIYRRSYR
jgi:alcohol dehydrogenase